MRCLEHFEDNISFHGIRPPLFVQARLQQYCRSPTFHSAYRSFSNAILSQNGEALLHNESNDKFFTRLCKIPNDLSVQNDVRLLRLQNILAHALTSKEFEAHVSRCPSSVKSMSLYIDTKNDWRLCTVQVGSCSLPSSFGFHEATPVLCLLLLELDCPSNSRHSGNFVNH